jgi:cellulose biosynthesis protein BcsQ
MANEKERLQQQIADLTSELQALTENLGAVQAKVDGIQEASDNLSNFIERLPETTSNDLEASKDDVPRSSFKKYLRQTIQKNLESADNNDLWLRKSLLSTQDIPTFLSVEQREQLGLKTRFLSFLNFKGGVGKTTLTSNLAAAFAAGNYKTEGDQYAPPLKVLVVDLDFQSTLSDRCMLPWEYIKAVNSDKTSSILLFKPEYSGLTIDHLTFPFVESANAKIIPAQDLLDVYDNKVFCYQLFQLYEMRFNYRLWFHNEQFMREYDLVIFDCPPRKTASVVCALTTSDYVFIPTAPESLDVQSISRTIIWLSNLKLQLKLKLAIGGIIFNRTHAETKLSGSEVDYRTQVESTIEDFFKNDTLEAPKNYLIDCETPSILKSFIPKRSGSNSIIGDACQALPGANREQGFITNLATEVYERIYQ